MRAHAKLSPSGAARWTKCTASPMLEQQFEDKPSEYAAEGTRAHELAEFLARTSLGLSWKGAPPKADDAEMQDAAEFYAMRVKEIYLTEMENCLEADIQTEVRLDLSEWIPDGFGTADCLICGEKVLTVIDFKYGKGVLVDAAENKQMMIYALGALRWASMIYDVETVRMEIIQPRLSGGSVWEIPATTLWDWGNIFLKPRAQEAYNGKGTFSPGEDTCRFCKASGSCKAQADYYVSLFDDHEDTGSLTDQDAGDLLERAAGMKDWIKSLEERVYKTLLDGGQVDGWKLVEGRSTRKYTDEAEIEKRLRAKKYKVADIYEKKMIGVTKMEKLLGKKRMGELIGDLIEKPRGAAQLAPATDKRPEYNPEDATLAAFDD